MSLLAIDLADRGLSLARAGSLLTSAPGVVFDGSTPEEPGTPAWHALRRQPTAVSTRHLGQVLAGRAGPRDLTVLQGQLTRLTAPVGERIWIATSTQATPAGLSACLGLTQALGLQVEGFAEAATAQAAALGLEQGALVLELGLHHLGLTLVERAGRHHASRRVLTRAGGWLDLLQSWTELVGRTLVRQTRFDPLHEGATEQQLFDALPTLVAQAQSHGTAQLNPSAWHALAPDLTVVLSRDQLAQAALAMRRQVMQLLQSLRTAGRRLCLLLPETLLTVPGLAQDLESLSGCELIALPEGFAARALSHCELPPASAPVRLLKRVPGGLQPLTLPVTSLGGRTHLPPPSHVLLGGEAHPLAQTLVVGSEPGEAPGVPARSLRLGGGLAGVSRRHCTFLPLGREIVLLDHSRFGTFVNGERVAERVRVHAGDRVRLGDPGVELALIAVGAESPA